MAANGKGRPDISRLFDFSALVLSANGHSEEDGQEPSYENSVDLNAITCRQMQEDISAYRYDIDFCRAMLEEPDITPSEIRTLHVRLLDCSHHVRHCQNRIELIDAQTRMGLNVSGALRGAPFYPNSKATSHHQQHPLQRSYSASTPGPGSGSAAKRKRPKMADSMVEEDEGAATATAAECDSIDVATGGGNSSTTSSVQRLGFWKCRLCTSQKYLSAGQNRVPSEPGKWPLRDVSKMLNHYLDLHTEHTPEERCKELGAALAQNQGPFEYWLTRTRLQEIKDLSTIDSSYVEVLQAGRLPEPLRSLNRAAAAFPNSVSGTKK